MPAERVAPPDPAAEATRWGTLLRIMIVVAVSLGAGLLYRLGNPHGFFDLRIYLNAMRWWADGNPLYDYVQTDPVQGELYFTYPPFTALLLRPFANIPLGAAIAIFTILTATAVAVTTWWLVDRTALARPRTATDTINPRHATDTTSRPRRATDITGRRHRVSRWSAVGLAILLVFAALARPPATTTDATGDPRHATDTTGRPRRIPYWFIVGLAIPLVFAVESVRETLTFGQINMLLVVLILADLLFAVPRASRWAGVGIGLATALKLFPGIFIAYLLATRRWRAATVASVTAAAATLLAAAVAPEDSWRFWTQELWSTGRVGRTDYTGNQSLFGLLSRLSAPDDPDRVLWLALAAVVAGYGLWRAARTARAGDEVAGLAMTGLVGALLSPITWTHHVYWFIPAVVVLLDAGLRAPGSGPGYGPGSAELGRRRRVTLLTLAVVVYAGIVYGVVSFYDWGFAPVPTDSAVEFVLRNLYVLLALLLLVVLPTRLGTTATVPGERARRRPKAPAGSG